MPIIKIEHHHVHHHVHHDHHTDIGTAQIVDTVRAEKIKLWSTFFMSGGYVIFTGGIVALLAPVLNVLLDTTSGAYKDWRIYSLFALLAACGLGMCWVGSFTLRHLKRR